MRKKILVLVLAAVLGIMTACGGGNSDVTDTPKPNDKVESKYAYVHDGKKITIGESAEEVLNKLGEPTSKFTNVSCAFEGEDHYYTYGTSLQIITNDIKGKETLTTIQLLDDLVETPEGIKIGDTDADVAKAYGAGDNGRYNVKDGKTSLVIVTKDNAVISITYSYEN